MKIREGRILSLNNGEDRPNNNCRIRHEKVAGATCPSAAAGSPSHATYVSADEIHRTTGVNARRGCEEIESASCACTRCRVRETHQTQDVVVRCTHPTISSQPRRAGKSQCAARQSISSPFKGRRLTGKRLTFKPSS